MPSSRAIEIAAWCAGALLLTAYGAMRAWSAYAGSQGLAAMRETRAQYAAAAQTENAAATLPGGAEAQHPTALFVAKPDTSTWAPKRLAEYRGSLGLNMTPGAVLRVPKLGLEVPVYEGTSDAILNRGAGRISATATIDSTTGNVGIAAHRDGFFRPLKDIEVGDAVLLDTAAATRRYRVTRLAVVDPSNVGVLDPTPVSTITLVTCYPFYHVGAAPKRFIAIAQLDQHGDAAYRRPVTTGRGSALDRVGR